jgi:trehalose/maltose transport system permease protein
MVPIGRNGLAACAILTFLGIWNEFLFALTFTFDNSARTVPVAIGFFTGASMHENPFARIMAASVVVTVPLIVLVLVFQKRIVAGLTAGAVKG